MNRYYITGASRGIGYALAEALLQDENNLVAGISRSEGLLHERFHHIQLNLEDVEEVAASADEIFAEASDGEEVVLINNAGYLGDIQYFGDIDHKEFIKVINTNTTAPAILMNAFIRRLKDYKGKKVILNIGSGAGRHPYDGWAAYCASKAAIDMLSSVADMENQIRKGNFRIVSLAPGPVDTVMQELVRSVDVENFSQKGKFIARKDAGTLPSAKEIADKIRSFIGRIDGFEGVYQDIRDIDLT